jgi:hypothetical protein
MLNSGTKVPFNHSGTQLIPVSGRNDCLSGGNGEVGRGRAKKGCTPNRGYSLLSLTVLF